MPYRTTQILLRLPTSISQPLLKSNSSINNETLNTVVTELSDVGINEELPKENRNSPTDGKEENESKDTCSLLCRPVLKRTSNMKKDKILDTTIRFHNPPKEIFKPAVEVCM